MKLSELTRTRIEDLPIPEGVRPGPGWTDAMVEMADHIGAYAVMQIVERFGGLEIYVPLDPARGVLAEVIGTHKAAIMSETYGRERLSVPVAAYALRHARRQGIVAAVRAKQLSLTEGAAILRTSRTYLSGIVNATDEGREAPPHVPSRRPPSQPELFDEIGEHEQAA